LGIRDDIIGEGKGREWLGLLGGVIRWQRERFYGRYAAHLWSLVLWLLLWFWLCWLLCLCWLLWLLGMRLRGIMSGESIKWVNRL
jgi:hypothetical protein